MTTPPPTPGVNLTDEQRGTALYRTAVVRRYIRDLVATRPVIVTSYPRLQVLGIEYVGTPPPNPGCTETLVLDLSDGTLVRLDITRCER